MTNLAQKHAIITGGGTGIGLEIAKSFGNAGAKVTIMGRNLGRLNDALEGLQNAQAVGVDVTSEENVVSAIKSATDSFGPCDILVNNAGIASSAPFHKQSLEGWNNIIGVNLTGVFLCTREVLLGMKANGWGRIINIASVAGHKAIKYTAAYVASKHGVIGLTKSLALDLAGDNITANSVCPGFTRTPMLENTVENIIVKTGLSENEALAILIKDNPQGRIIEPEEIAETTLWLCSDGEKSINGQSIMVAGGEVS